MGWEQGGEHFLNVSKQLNSVYSSKRFIPFISSIMAVLGKDVRACVCVCLFFYFISHSLDASSAKAKHVFAF